MSSAFIRVEFNAFDIDVNDLVFVGFDGTGVSSSTTEFIFTASSVPEPWNSDSNIVTITVVTNRAIKPETYEGFQVTLTACKFYLNRV